MYSTRVEKKKTAIMGTVVNYMYDAGRRGRKLRKKKKKKFNTAVAGSSRKIIIIRIIRNINHSEKKNCLHKQVRSTVLRLRTQDSRKQKDGKKVFENK